MASHQPLDHRRFPAEGSHSRNDYLLHLHLRGGFSHGVVAVHSNVMPNDTIQHCAGVNLVKAQHFGSFTTKRPLGALLGHVLSGSFLEKRAEEQMADGIAIAAATAKYTLLRIGT